MEKQFYTRVIMDDGREYVFPEHPEDIIGRFQSDDGVLHNGFVHFARVSIVPTKILSVETIDTKKEGYNERYLIW